MLALQAKHANLSLDHKTVHARHFCTTMVAAEKLPSLLILLLLSLAVVLSSE